MLNGSFKEDITFDLRGYPVDGSLHDFPDRLATISGRPEGLSALIQDAVVPGPCRDHLLSLRDHEAIALLDALQTVHPALYNLALP